MSGGRPEVRPMKNPLQNTTVEFRRSRNLVKLVVLAVVILSTVTLLVLGSAIVKERSRAESSREEAIALEQDNDRWRSYIEELGTVRGILRIAREKLGLVDPDTIVIQPE